MPQTSTRSDRRLIVVSGEQAEWFLQNTISADLDVVEPATFVESCFLSPKGKVISHFRVGVGANRACFYLDAVNAGPLAEWFLKYRFRTKAEITVCSGEPTLRTVSSNHKVGSFEESLTAFDIAIGEHPARLSYGDQAPTADAPDFDRLRIEAGLAEFGRDYDDTNLPQEAGLGSTISVTKGCYVGQEVMARLHFRGRVNKTIRRLELARKDASAVAGSKIHLDDKLVGRVTSSINGFAIAMVSISVPPSAAVTLDDAQTAVVGNYPEGTKSPKHIATI